MNEVYTRARRRVTLRAPDRLKTARLSGSRITRSDLEDFKAYYGDPLVMRSLSPDGEPYTAEAATELFAGHVAHWAAHGYGTWIFRDDADTFVGRAGLRAMELDGEPCVELFYGVASSRWGCGYATEVAREIIAVAFGPLRLEDLVAFALPSNQASLGVLAKCGFEEVGELEHAGLTHGLYRLHRS